MRCGFTRSTSECGPRGGIKVRHWRCSRQGKHLGAESDPYYHGRPCMLCTQHLKIVEASRKRAAEVERRYQEFLKRDKTRTISH